MRFVAFFLLGMGIVFVVRGAIGRKPRTKTGGTQMTTRERVTSVVLGLMCVLGGIAWYRGL